MNRKQPLRSMVYLLAFAAVFAACKSKHPTSVKPGKESTATGINYNKENGFQVAKYRGQSAGPNLVFIEGGRFTMGALEEDVMNSRDNRERTVSIQSFYMDETEIANIHYLEYLDAIQRDSSEEIYTRALPDTNVWKNPLSYNDPYVTQYLRFPGFRYYPVVGVSWEQAVDYSTWRTDAVNANMARKGSSTGKKKGFSLKRKRKQKRLRLPKANRL
jgi:sulfatase modifying factor 1